MIRLDRLKELADAAVILAFGRILVACDGFGDFDEWRPIDMRGNFKFLGHISPCASGREPMQPYGARQPFLNAERL